MSFSINPRGVSTGDELGRGSRRGGRRGAGRRTQDPHGGAEDVPLQGLQQHNEGLAAAPEPPETGDRSETPGDIGGESKRVNR